MQLCKLANIFSESGDILMKIKDIKKVNMSIYDNEDLLYQGPSDQVPVEIQNFDTKSIKFDGQDLKIIIKK